MSFKKLFNQSGVVHTLPLILIVVAIGIISFLLITSTAPLNGLFGTLNPKPASHAATTTGCGLTNPAFCDTFDQPMPQGNDRSGDLNGLVWGASRVRGGGWNSGQGMADNWVTNVNMTGSCGSITVTADQDIKICNGKLNDAVDDNYLLNSSNNNTTGNPGLNDAGDVTALTMYPKQPFDFAGRTGKVVFDVSDDSAGMHAAWPEFWITDKPVPNPFAHFASWQSLPQNGFGLRLGRVCSPGQGGNCGSSCPTNNAGFVVSVSSAILINNYVENDGDNGGSVQVQGDGCVKEPTQPGVLNHFEVDVSQSQIDVYGTDAGTTSPLVHLATIPNTNLGFTRGLIWLEDVHYNANKEGLNFGIPQGIHTFTWDNVGFDGPILPRDLAFEAPDALSPLPAYPTTTNLGWYNYGGATSTDTVTVPNVSGISNASGGLLEFNFFNTIAPVNFTYSLNGNTSHTYNWPYADNLTGSPRTIAIPISLSEVVPGNNIVKITDSDTGGLFISNVAMIMAGAGGIPCSINPSEPCNGSPLPTSIATPTSVPSPTTPPSPTPVPTPTPPPGNTTTIDDSVQGTGTNQFNYIGTGWAHCTNCANDPTIYNDSNSWDQTAGDTVTFQFNGQQAAFYGVLDPSEGMGAFSVDGGTETQVNFFNTTRAGNHLLYTTPILSAGTHTLKLRVTGITSGGTTAYVTADRVDVTTTATSTPSPTTSPSCPKASLGDIDCDGTIGIFDYNILLSNFGKTETPNTQGDLDGDGKVGIFDYNILLGNFGK